jgi:hypothetical protein
MLFPVTDWPCKRADTGELIHKPGKRDPHGWQEAHEAALHTSSLGRRGEKGDALEEIKYNGWSTKAASPFGELLWMKRSFFSCFSICFLHLELLGLLKVHMCCRVVLCCRFLFLSPLTVVGQRHLRYTCTKHNISEELNRRIKNYGAFPGKDGFTTRFDFAKKRGKMVCRSPRTCVAFVLIADLQILECCFSHGR